MPEVSEVVIRLGGFTIEIQQSIFVWLCICVLAMFFFYFAGKKIEKADPSKPTQGLVYVCEEMYNLILYVVQGNLKETTTHYIPMFGTLILLMVVANLTGPDFEREFQRDAGFDAVADDPGQRDQKSGTQSPFKGTDGADVAADAAEHHRRARIADFIDDAFIW